MARSPQCFKVKVEFEPDIDGKPGYESHVVAVSRNTAIQSAADAVRHVMTAIGRKPDGTVITLIHHKDQDIGKFFSLKSAVPVREEPYDIDESAVIRSIEDAPQPEKAGE